MQGYVSKSSIQVIASEFFPTVLEYKCCVVSGYQIPRENAIPRRDTEPDALCERHISKNTQTCMYTNDSGNTHVGGSNGCKTSVDFETKTLVDQQSTFYLQILIKFSKLIDIPRGRCLERINTEYHMNSKLAMLGQICNT